MNEKLVLVGAGSAMFTRGLVADVIARGWSGEVALVDVDPHALAVAEGLARKMIRARSAPISVSASTDRRLALPDATAVVCTIGVGGRRAWERDVFIPRRYGIYQPVGDTVMPGGASRALRMIPAMVAIARDVLDLCPDALFFNYGNPMACVCRAVRKATGAEMVGLCHGVLQVTAFLADALGLSPADLDYAAVGMNHLTWFTRLGAEGRDLMPRLVEVARAKLAEAGEPDEQNRFTWELTELFGAFPAVLDRHVTEFFPHMFARAGAYFGKTLGVDAYRFEDAVAYGDRTFAEMREIAESGEPLADDFFDRLSGEHEQVCEIIESIRSSAGGACSSPGSVCSIPGGLCSANIPNTGQVPNLPAGAVIECPARAEADGIRAIPQPPLAPGLAGTLATRLEWVETVVDAALEGSYDIFAQALLLDGAVTSIDQARRLADDLLAAQAEHLPQFSGSARHSS